LFSRFLLSSLSSTSLLRRCSKKNQVPDWKDFDDRLGCGVRFRADTPYPGFVTITPDRAAGTLVMNGRAYAPDGKAVAVWGTLASCIYLKEKKLYYFWRGHHPASPKDTWEGFGAISFRDSQGLSNSADCLYFDTNLWDAISITRKSSDYWRCTKREADIMHGSDNEGIGALVREKMQIGRSKRV
jgi:hypothetical protein